MELFQPAQCFVYCFLLPFCLIWVFTSHLFSFTLRNCDSFKSQFWRQTSEHRRLDPSPAIWDLRSLEWLPPWLNLSKSTNHTEGKSQTPLSRAAAAFRYVGVSLWRSRELRWVFFFFQDRLVRSPFKEAEDSEGFIECKMSGLPVSRRSLRKSVGVKLEGKWLTVSVREGAETNFQETLMGSAQLLYACCLSVNGRFILYWIFNWRSKITVYHCNT